MVYQIAWLQKLRFKKASQSEIFICRIKWSWSYVCRWEHGVKKCCVFNIIEMEWRRLTRLPKMQKMSKVYFLWRYKMLLEMSKINIYCYVLWLALKFIINTETPQVAICFFWVTKWPKEGLKELLGCPLLRLFFPDLHFINGTLPPFLVLLSCKCHRAVGQSKLISNRMWYHVIF